MTTGNEDKAEQIVHIAESMVSLFDLREYGAFVPKLQLSLFQNDVEVLASPAAVLPVICWTAVI